jgi:hypothetical protein
MERKSTLAARGGRRKQGKNGNGRNGNGSAMGKSRARGPARSRAGELKFADAPLSQAAPVAFTRVVKTNRPSIRTMRNGDCRIVHREYIADISAGAGAPSAFNLSSFPINPGQVLTYPWLSKIAANYESYMFNALRFCYETEAATSLGGTLVLSVDYDASDAAPLDKKSAMAYRGSVRSAPWKACCHSSILEDLRKSKTNFVRPGAQPANTDIKTLDVGNLFVVSQGVSTAAAVLGELWVEYDVLLMTPVYDGVGSSVIVGGSALNAGGTAQTAANPFGTDGDSTDIQSVGFSVDNASLLNFQYVGLYLVAFNCSGTVITADSLVGGAGRVVANVVRTINAAATTITSLYTVTVTTPGTLAYTMTATTVTSTFVLVGQAPLLSLSP